MKVIYKDIVVYITLIHTKLKSAVSIIPSSPLLLPPLCPLFRSEQMHNEQERSQ